MKKMRSLGVGVLIAVALLSIFGSPGPASADERIRARLQGFQEIPAISSEAKGEFRGKIGKQDDSIEYELSYKGLTGNVTQAHIHFAQKGVNGGISVWLCQSATNPGPMGVPVCPLEGTVTGTLTAANVIGPAGQGIAAGEFSELVRAIRAGVTYANVHSSQFPGGEIRGQINASHGQWDED